MHNTQRTPAHNSSTPRQARREASLTFSAVLEHMFRTRPKEEGLRHLRMLKVLLWQHMCPYVAYVIHM